jgi:hypothetical protein
MWIFMDEHLGNTDKDACWWLYHGQGEPCPLAIPRCLWRQSREDLWLMVARLQPTWTTRHLPPVSFHLTYRTQTVTWPLGWTMAAWTIVVMDIQTLEKTHTLRKKQYKVILIYYGLTSWNWTCKFVSPQMVIFFFSWLYRWSSLGKLLPSKNTWLSVFKVWLQSYEY